MTNQSNEGNNTESGQESETNSGEAGTGTEEGPETSDESYPDVLSGLGEETEE